ncbi:triose-phosphate isomerase [Pelistega sp. NLN82]|uniref:Triosephosphate isomerase n=1 Tax=Pelistega ratti TaxID=2652177 RepID=A0A6L9Y776_9BURK|nr:triose-phosphate isomerase [Pelistega ratti]NEN75628.1 triose-phosphate isomerase [Pelistega ratti]
MRQRLVMGNWKMNGNLRSNSDLLSAIARAEPESAQVVVCPPFPYLAQAQSVLSNTPIQWGAQDISLYEKGAYTGEVSVGMLNDFACQWVIVGHSERRAYHAETSDTVAAKAKIALQHGLTPVVCVGELLSEREEGRTLSVIEAQLSPVLALGTEVVKALVIAYEPVWAIGTGLTATPEQAQEVHAFIRQLLSRIGAEQVRIVYGGSVKANNASRLFSMPDIDGALVGGAALDAKEFLAIVAA